MKFISASRKGLGLTELSHFDEEHKYPSGNPKPIGNSWANRGKRGYYVQGAKFRRRIFFPTHEMMPHSDGFWWTETEVTGGYCTPSAITRLPGIFSNFNGTSDDIDADTRSGPRVSGMEQQSFHLRNIRANLWSRRSTFHEHGVFHLALMRLFLRSNWEIPVYDMARSPVYPPYGVADEFRTSCMQSRYDAGRTKTRHGVSWKRPTCHTAHGDNQHLLAERFWQRQNHIFNSPFYYIDYTLAQICAFQFWLKTDRWSWKSLERLFASLQVGRKLFLPGVVENCQPSFTIWRRLWKAWSRDPNFLTA